MGRRFIEVIPTRKISLRKSMFAPVGVDTSPPAYWEESCADSWANNQIMSKSS
jgi:hypothetical protein